MNHLGLSFLLLFLALGPAALAADHIVDASGATGSFTSIQAAMLASAPGDRILVLPGQYSGFQFSRGVHVVGLGATPNDVLVAGSIGFHVSVPALDYDARVSNLTVQSTDPLGVFAISGNELAPGTLVLDGVVLRGGVFLRGGEDGFYLAISNSSIVPDAGEGFSGEACFLGGPGNFVDIRNATIRGWDADPTALAPAGIGLRVGGGTTARISNSVIRGGDGAAVIGYLDGATAIASTPPGSVTLRLEGGVSVLGGTGVGTGAGGAGGDAVAIVGMVETGAAVVTPGAGSPAGVAYAFASPTVLDVDPHLDVTPHLVDGAGDVAAGPGDTVTFATDSHGPRASSPSPSGCESPTLPSSSPFPRRDRSRSSATW